MGDQYRVAVISNFVQWAYFVEAERAEYNFENQNLKLWGVIVMTIAEVLECCEPEQNRTRGPNQLNDSKLRHAKQECFVILLPLYRWLWSELAHIQR